MPPIKFTMPHRLETKKGLQDGCILANPLIYLLEADLFLV